VIAKSRRFAAAEAVECERHRDRHVDTNHTDFNLVGKGARGGVVLGEYGGTVAVRVVGRKRRPASTNSSASRSGQGGSFSEGLSTTVLPVIRAMPDIHSGIIAGKLNGVMPATTPSGLRIE
jgi:hypothetical protein